MAGSRFHKIGDIFTRTTGLLRSGAMKPQDKPLWYDVYEAFPPHVPPSFGRQKPEINIRQIFYPEDIIRAKFYRKYGSPGTMSLNEIIPDRRQSLCETFVRTYQVIEKAEPQLSEEEVTARVERQLESRGIYLDRSKMPQKPSGSHEPGGDYEPVEEMLETRRTVTSADLPDDVLQKFSLSDIFHLTSSKGSITSTSSVRTSESGSVTDTVQTKMRLKKSTSSSGNLAAAVGEPESLYEEDDDSEELTGEEERLLMETVEKLNKHPYIMDEKESEGRKAQDPKDGREK